ncbi:MAG: hypothetical protein H6825_00785 [Planctomycetes bacterium]|nr:hypothetical protein [Planctomycetota bacterium]
MDKKAKKRIEVLQKKRHNLIGQLGVVKRHPDDPAEIPKLEAEIARVEAELAKLKQG